MRLIGIEHTHAAPEATALSTELQTHYINDTTICRMLQAKNEKSCYCTRVGIFWTENAVWYSGGNRFCRFRMRSIGKIRYCLRNAWTVTVSIGACKCSESFVYCLSMCELGAPLFTGSFRRRMTYELCLPVPFLCHRKLRPMPQKTLR